MTANAPSGSGWQMAVLSPREICTDEGWDSKSNFVIAIVYPPARQVSVDKYSYLVEADWWRRQTSTASILYNKLHTSQPSLLTVHFHSDAAEFFPLTPHVRKGWKFFEHATFEEALRSVPGPCEVRFTRDGVGLAAFVARYRLVREMDPRGRGAGDYRKLANLSWKLRNIAKNMWGAPQTASAMLSASGLVLAQAQVPFVFSEKQGTVLQSTTVAVFRRIFASYAREDLEVVESIDSVLRALEAGELRWDLKILKSGMDWNAALINEIETADIFQLFWSDYAKASEHVRREYLHALKFKPSDFVRPVFWRDPLPEPSSELAHLHFARITLPHTQRVP